MITMLLLLISGHCLADTALQPEKMEKGKNRNNPIDLSRVPKGQKPLKLWWMWLLHHSMIHGGIVYLITGNALCFVLEIVSHWVIDFFKCDNKYDPYVDQSLHIWMKTVYLLIFRWP